MDIEFANRVIDNASLVLNVFLAAWVFHACKIKNFWIDDWHKARSEVRRLELELHQCKAYNRSIYQELGKFDKERSEYYFYMADKLAKFVRVGGSE
jgi:hypothetical protein